MIRTVIQAGDPRLKAKNKLIISFNSPKTKKLIKDLVDTMYKTDLIGIAAPQIGENYLVFVTHLRDTAARKLLRADELRIFINPQISYFSQNQNEIYEGCGSVGGNIDDAGIFGPVKRPEVVEVTAFDARGQKFSLRADGILARVMQHEYDHLQGIEFIQKLSDYSKIYMEPWYRKKIRTSPLQRKNSKVTKVEYKKI